MRRWWAWLCALCWCAATPAQAGETVDEHVRLTRQAMEHHASHQHDDAIARGEEALAAAKRAFGDDGERVADMHYNLARFLAARGRWADAKTHDQRALAIYVAHRGPHHPWVAQVHSRLAEAHGNLFEYDAALAAADRALAVTEQGEALDGVYDFTLRAAEAYSIAQRPEGAAERYARAVALGEKLWGRDSPQLVSATIAAGQWYHEAQRYDVALGWHRRALALVERHIGAQSKEASSVVNNIASALFQLGRYNESLPVFERALSLSRKLWGEGHVETATIRLNHAHLLLALGRAEEAERTARAAVAVIEQADPSKRAFGFLTLSEVLHERRAWDEAAEWGQRAAAEIERHYGPAHPRLADALLNLSLVARRRGAWDEARAHATRARDMLEASPTTSPLLTAYAYLELARSSRGDEAIAGFARALALREEVLGAQHHLLAQSHGELAWANAAVGRWREALSHQQQHNDIRETTLSVAMEVASEAQRAAVAQGFAREVDDTLTIHLRGLPDDAAAADAAMLALLRRKGRVLDAMAGGLGALRRRASPSDRRLLDELSDVRRQLASLVIAAMVDKTAEDPTAHIALLQRRAQQLEEALGRRMHGIAGHTPASLAALDAALDDGAAYLDYALFQPVRFGDDDARCAPLHYAVYLRRKGAPVRAIDLGPATALEPDVRALRSALSSPDGDPAPAAARLYRALLAPVAPWLEGVSRLHLSPDGALNLIPFGALVAADGRYAVERWLIRYLSSGRDLLRPRSSEPPRQPGVVIGAPAFGTPSADAALRFEPLPGAEDEARALGKLLPRARLLVGAQASEGALAALHGPAVLHVATHGFFLSPSATGVGFPCTRAASLVELNVPERERHPLLMSGLALAGANGGAGPRQDGVLTALEASSLDLHGTQLLVLSACETGVGDVRQGDGVHGLRRAFAVAGAETQVMSLWKVDDQATRKLMLGYYAGLRRGAGRVAAMRDVQLAMLADPATRHPFYWAGFIVSGHDGPLDGEQLMTPASQAPAARGCACEIGATDEPPWWSVWLVALVLAARCRPPRRPCPSPRLLMRPRRSGSLLRALRRAESVQAAPGRDPCRDRRREHRRLCHGRGVVHRAVDRAERATAKAFARLPPGGPATGPPWRRHTGTGPRYRESAASSCPRSGRPATRPHRLRGRRHRRQARGRALLPGARLRTRRGRARGLASRRAAAHVPGHRHHRLGPRWLTSRRAS